MASCVLGCPVRMDNISNNFNMGAKVRKNMHKYKKTNKKVYFKPVSCPFFCFHYRYHSVNTWLPSRGCPSGARCFWYFFSSFFSSLDVDISIVIYQIYLLFLYTFGIALPIWHPHTLSLQIPCPIRPPSKKARTFLPALEHNSEF